MAPLRKIVGTRGDFPLRPFEILECGHEQRQKTDIYGPTNAYARRCRKCHIAATRVPGAEERGE